MESRPSPAAASRAWALRRTLHRSPLPCRLCSTPLPSPGPQTPEKITAKLAVNNHSKFVFRRYEGQWLLLVVCEEHQSGRWNAPTVLMDLAELERCSWLLRTAVLNLSVAFLVPKPGTATEGGPWPWQVLLIAIGLLRGDLASFGEEKGGEVVAIGLLRGALVAVWLVVLNKMPLSYAMLLCPQVIIIKMENVCRQRPLLICK